MKLTDDEIRVLVNACTLTIQRDDNLSEADEAALESAREKLLTEEFNRDVFKRGYREAAKTKRAMNTEKARTSKKAK